MIRMDFLQEIFPAFRIRLIRAGQALKWGSERISDLPVELVAAQFDFGLVLTAAHIRDSRR